jgi:flagellar hook-length control protein FliK
LRLEGAILGSGSVIVGFAPAGTAPQAGNSAAGKPNAAATPFGLFESIFALIAGSEGANTPNAEGAAPALASLTNPTVPPDFAAPANAEPAPKTPLAMAPGGGAAFGKLMQALAALGESLASGTQLDPALEAKIAQALDKLAGVLGLPTPEPVAVAPALAAAGTVPAPGAGGIVRDPTESQAGPDPLAAPAGAATDAPTPVTPSPAPQGPIAPTAAALPTGAPVEPGTTPSAPVATGPDAPETTEAPLPHQEAKPVPPVAVQLAERILELAAALEPRAPGLAKRLTALAQKLTSGGLDPDVFAKLGINPTVDLPEEDIADAVDRLLGANRDIKGAPAPQAFAAARLALPGDIVLPPDGEEAAARPKQASEAANAPGSARTTPPPEPVTQREAALEALTPARPDKTENAPSTRPSFSAAFQASLDSGEPRPPPQALPGASLMPAAATADAKAAHAAYSAPVRQINIPQIAFEIVRNVEAGASRFQIRLDPPELGRVDVKLEVDAAGNVKARLTVERAETLDLMQRDQRSLERALAQAGLDSAKTNLEFSLRQNPFARDGQGQGQGGSGHGSPFAGPAGPAEADDAAAAAQIVAYRGLASPGGVNLFV